MVYKLFGILISLLIVVQCANAQQIQPLSPEKQDEINKILEVASIFEMDKDLLQAGSQYVKAAFIYWESSSPHQAIDVFLKAAGYYEKTSNFADLKAIYTNVGVIYADIDEINKSLKYFEKSLDVRQKIGDREDVSAGMIDVAYIYYAKGDYKESVKYLKDALELAVDVKNSSLILSCYGLLSQSYNETGNIGKAQEFSEKLNSYQTHIEEQGLKDDFEEKEAKSRTEIEETKAEKHAKELELKMNKLLAGARQDSLNTVISAKQDSIADVERANRQKQIEIDLLNKERELQDLALKEKESKQRAQATILWAGSGVLILMLLLAFILYRNAKAKQKVNQKLESQNKRIEKQKNAIENKNKEIEDAFDKITAQALSISQSINYAQGIQKSMLPDIESIKKYLPESFIVFYPRDVVSGDFYWFSEIDDQSNVHNVLNHFMQRSKGAEKKNEKKEEKRKNFAISAVDCTGHGVPGAFMSMIGYNHLDEIIGRGITRVDLILDELHKGIRSSLNQDTTDNKDGMDMALCVINRAEKRLEFAGAKNPLVYIKNGEIVQIKGDKNTIGGVQSEDNRKFEKHHIDIDGPTYIYIFSDGFVDQFGGEMGRKYLIKNFRNFLLKIHKKPMNEQKELIEQEIKNWIGTSYKQVDDILIMGFKLDVDLMN